MSPADAQKLLAFAAVFDNRKPDPTGMAACAWAETLDGLEFDECRRAIVRHFRGTTAYLMPAHIRDLVTAERREAQVESWRAQSRRNWRELQPPPEKCVPMSAEIKAQILEIANRRKLPADVESEAPPTTETA
jgi:hypothetical protein